MFPQLVGDARCQHPHDGSNCHVSRSHKATASQQRKDIHQLQGPQVRKKKISTNWEDHTSAIERCLHLSKTDSTTWVAGFISEPGPSQAREPKATNAAGEGSASAARTRKSGHHILHNHGTRWKYWRTSRTIQLGAAVKMHSDKAAATNRGNDTYRSNGISCERALIAEPSLSGWRDDTPGGSVCGMDSRPVKAEPS